MRVARFWDRESEVVTTPDGDRIPVVAWGGSQTSADDARSQARERLRALVARIRASGLPDAYPYADRPLREEWLEDVGWHDQAVAAVTRNGYGAEILNTADVMFVDIDDRPEGAWTRLLRLLGLGSGARESATIARLRGWSANHPEWSFRLYRTAKGYRMLVTHARFEPGAGATLEHLRALDADPLYTRLCRAQGCFRARLTPKPWRLGLEPPPRRFPRRGAAERGRFEQWLGRYEDLCRGFATCEGIEIFGRERPDGDVARVIDLHDRRCRVGAQLPLA